MDHNADQTSPAGCRSEEGSTLTARVWRGDLTGAYQAYVVPVMQNQTVLDVVTWIQRNLEPGLSYRFACRVGMCGSCAMRVNGTPRWTCRTHVSQVLQKGKLQIAPLANLPVIKDLACDMRDFFEKWQKAQGRFEETGTRGQEVCAIRPDTAERQAADAAIECINCAVCYSACDTVQANRDYLGPAALNRAWTLVNDVRDGAGNRRLAAISAEGGCFDCHSHQSCERHCPVGLNPARSIAALKRRTLRAYLRGELER